MFGEDSVFAEGVVVAIRSDRAYEVKLPNGHRLIAFVTRKDRGNKKSIEIGMKIPVRCSPFDLSKGQIVYLTV
ncbi:MAG: translation initiation factor IF-1 [Verrucomicrobiia bacterium]|jgi:translation initiation factor IF-1